MKRKPESLKGRLRSLPAYKRVSRSLFGKYFAACAAIILLCFLFLGTVVITLSVQYSNSQRRELFRQNAKTLAGAANSAYNSVHTRLGYTNAASIELASDLQYFADLFSSINGADILIVSTEGNLIASSGNVRSDDFASGADLSSVRVPTSVMNWIKEGKTLNEIGTLAGFFSGQYLTVGMPILDDSKSVIGGVFISSPAASLMSYIYFIIRILLICICITLLFAFAALYYLTLRLVRPLRQMSSAAKSFAKGDFTQRVPVGDNDEVGELAVAFNNMAASLTTLEDMRRSFVANVSHELKTPMTSIAGFIDGILDDTIPREKHEYYLKIVSDEVKRLSRLVRQFLDIARIEAGELKITPAAFDVNETMRRVIVGFEYAIDEKHLEVRGLDEEADTQMMAFADPDLTHQIIYNLVDNAVKFADPGGYIEIHVAALSRKVYVSVKNSGMGIPQKDLPYVFERFYKTDKSRSLDRKGVGLGLYIAKTVLNLQNEDISVKSVEGEFCEFVFTLQAV